jgi:hypothetical protein
MNRRSLDEHLLKEIPRSASIQRLGLDLGETVQGIALGTFRALPLNSGRYHTRYECKEERAERRYERAMPSGEAKEGSA